MCGIVGYIGYKQAAPILIRDFISWSTEVTIVLELL